MSIKPQHWRGFQGKNARKGSPVLGFTTLIFALSAVLWMATPATNSLAAAPRICDSMHEGVLLPDDLASPALKRWVVWRCALPRPQASSSTMLAMMISVSP